MRVHARLPAKVTALTGVLFQMIGRFCCQQPLRTGKSHRLLASTIASSLPGGVRQTLSGKRLIHSPSTGGLVSGICRTGSGKFLAPGILPSCLQASRRRNLRGVSNSRGTRRALARNRRWSGPGCGSRARARGCCPRPRAHDRSSPPCRCQPGAPLVTCVPRPPRGARCRGGTACPRSGCARQSRRRGAVRHAHWSPTRSRTARGRRR